MRAMRRRNKIKHEGKSISAQRRIHNITRHMHMLIRVRRPNMRCPVNWSEMIQELEKYRPRMNAKLIKWEYPPKGWFKYNTDGASIGNPGRVPMLFT